MPHNTETSFTAPPTIAVGKATKQHDYENLRTNQVFFNSAFDSIGVASITPSAGAGALLGDVTLASGQNITMSNTSNLITFDVPTAAGGLISVSNTTTGNTITGSYVLQGGDNIGITVSGSQFLFTATSAGGGGVTQPSFLAFKSDSQIASIGVETTVAFSGTTIDVIGSFNTTTSRWTPSITGKYIIGSHLNALGSSGSAGGNRELKIYLDANGVLRNLYPIRDKGGQNFSGLVNVTTTTNFIELTYRSDINDTLVGDVGPTNLSCYFYGIKVSDN